LGLIPRVAHSSQPWAECRHPFGVMEKGQINFLTKKLL
jgi:hypothetical protein